MVTSDTLTTSLVQQRLKSPKWIDVFLWGLCFLPVVHAGLLFSITDPRSSFAIAIHFLRPLGILGAVGILFLSAFLGHGRRRVAWIFNAVWMIFSIVYSILRITQLTPVTAPIMVILVVLIYSFALIAVALYLDYRSLWVGSTPRAVMGGITVGWAALVLMQSILPVMFPLWHMRANSLVPFVAFDMGILFAEGVVTLRYGLNKRPLLPLILLSLTCLLIADVIYLVLLLIPGAIQFYWMVMPLYTMNNILVAFAAYRDVTSVNPSLSFGESSVMSLREWLFWTFAPLVAVFGAFTATSLVGKVSSVLLFGLLVVAIVHEVLAAFDYRRVLQNLRSTYSQLQQQAEKEAVMEERHRLARELHDSTCQLLSGQALIAEAGLQMISQGDLKRSAEYVARLRDVAQDAHRDMRLLLYELRPPALEENGLLEVLHQRLEGVERRAGVEASLVMEGDKLPAPIEEVFYRVASEALNNASRYAAATAVKVLISAEGERAELAVTDNGKGFDLEAASQRGGLGLITMRERVEKLGGTLTIISSPGQGTQVKASLGLGQDLSGLTKHVQKPQDQALHERPDRSDLLGRVKGA